ncbi:hypothetical protein Tco_1573632 [Tanacetum coccineum]
MKEFMTNDHKDYYSGITCITVNGKNAYELKRKFLDDLHNNAFDGTNGEDVVKHIEYFLRIVDPYDLPNIMISLQKILRNSKLMKNLKTIGFINGTKTYLGWTKDFGLTHEYGKNRNQSNILASLSTIKLDVQNGQHVVGGMMDSVMEETYLELHYWKLASLLEL